MGESIARYQNLMDNRLSDLLGSFSEYDFEYKPLFNQREFERQLYPLIEPLMARPEKERYSSVYELFMNIFKLTCDPPKNSYLAKDFKSQYNKFITLIDICVLVSKIQSTDFSEFPREILMDLTQFDLFDEVDDIISQYGRINYKFPMKPLKQKRKEYIHDHPDPSRMRRKKKKKNVRTTAMLLDELTEKLLSKPSSSKDKEEQEDDMPFLEGKNACCRPENKENKDKTASISSSEEELSSDDDVFQEAIDNPLDTKAAASSRFNNKQQTTTTTTTATKIIIEEANDNASEIDDAPSPDDLSDESEQDDEDDEDSQGLINRTTLKLHRNKLGASKRSNRNSSKDLKVVSNNDELIPSAVKAKERKQKQLKKEEDEKNKKLKRKKRRASSTSSSTITKPQLKKNCILSKNRFQNNWRVVIEPNLNFLYLKLESKYQLMEPHMTKLESNGFIYKPAQFTLFEDMNETETFNKTEFKSLDQLINSFLLQSYKRAGGCKHDSQMFLHPLEFAYIQEHLSKIKESSATKLPPLLFGNRWQSLLKDKPNGYTSEGVSKLNIKATKVKDVWLLKPFANEEQYWDHFKKIVPRSEVSKRLDFLNKIISDSDNNLFVCDDLDRIQEFVNQNHELLELSDDDADELEEEEEEEVLESQFETQPSTVTVAPKKPETVNESNDTTANKTDDLTTSPVAQPDKKPVRETDDNRSTCISTLRGVWVSCKSVKRILAPQDQFKVLSNFLFPSLRPHKEYKGVPQHAIDDLCDVYSGFRPYLMSLFIDDVYEFSSMPMYFKLDSTMFELQVQDYFKKKKNKISNLVN